MFDAHLASTGECHSCLTCIKGKAAVLKGLGFRDMKMKEFARTAMAQTPLHPKLVEICALPGRALSEFTPEEARRNFIADRKAAEAPAPQMPTRDFTIPGPAGPLGARLYTPPGLPAKGNPILIYFHGGGWYFGNVDTHDPICRMLAAHTPCVVLSIDYRLAPENPFPAAVDDAYAALAWTAAHAAELGADAPRIAVGGDSAGANLAAVISILARDNKGPAISQQLLFYPVTDLTAGHESYRLFGKGYILDQMPFFIASYLGEKGDARDPLASPLHAKDFSRLPRAYVLTAGYDPLRDEGQDYARALADAGVPVTSVCAEDMTHGFLGRRNILERPDIDLKNAAKALADGFSLVTA
jgi:acetyl esterase